LKITNKHNLPEAVYNFLARDRYVAGDNDISVTTLIGPALKAHLIREHNEELETDAMDLVWSLLGNGVHNLLENHTVDGVSEERLYAERMGVRIGGQIDNRHGSVISDYKVTSTYKIQRQEFSDWENQLNVYAWLCRNNDIEITELKIITFLRDWRESELLRNPDYPKTPCVVVKIALWDELQQEDYVHDRLLAHKAIAPCTDKEMWAEPDKWAVYKKGGKRATKLCETEEEAQAYIKANSSKAYGVEYYIEHRKGQRRHCQRYCAARDICPQWKAFNSG
jgi:hypothetical protein